MKIFPILFQLWGFCGAQLDSGTSHIGPVAQIVHYAYSVISCATEAWLTFRNDVYGKIKDKLFSFKFFNFDITNYNKKFLSLTFFLTINRESLNSFTNGSFADIDKLKKSFLKFNKSVTDSDTRMKTVLDNLTRTAYEKSVSAMYSSLIQNKNCVPNIVSAMRDMFNGFLDALHECTDEMININAIDFGLSNGFAIVTGVYTLLKNCIYNVRRTSRPNLIAGAQKCVTNVLKVNLIREYEKL